MIFLETKEGSDAADTCEADAKSRGNVRVTAFTGFFSFLAGMGERNVESFIWQRLLAPPLFLFTPYL